MNKQELLKSFVLNSEEFRVRIKNYNKIRELSRSIKNNAPDDVKVALANLWMEAEMKVGEGTGDPELENKYNDLLKQYNKLESIHKATKKNKQHEIDKLIHENKNLRCKVSTLEFDNKISRKKLDNIMNDWVKSGGDLDEYLKMVDKGISQQFETESAILLKNEPDDGYVPYSDEDN
jgi:seryl-tRNA synthetase